MGTRWEAEPRLKFTRGDPAVEPAGAPQTFRCVFGGRVGNEEEELSTHLGLKGELDFPKSTPGDRLYSEGSSTPVTSESCYVDQRKLLVV